MGPAFGLSRHLVVIDYFVLGTLVCGKVCVLFFWALFGVDASASGTRALVIIDFYLVFFTLQVFSYFFSFPFNVGSWLFLPV